MSFPRPTPVDAFPTSTSTTQAETEAVLRKHIAADPARASILAKKAHMQFLVRNLVQGFPSGYTSQDASQPWLMFWLVQAFSVLQVGIDPGNRQRIINKILATQHPDGGFAGGPGQSAHLLPNYAAICTLAIVGRPGPGGGWDQIDRKKMYQFFMSLKQSDGSFLVGRHAEVDVRGIYCLLIVATLLDILTPELVDGTASFIASCQTYEGGFASASQPYYAVPSIPPSSSPSLETPPLRVLDNPRPALGEAHGGYTFCALAAWVLLQPFENTAAHAVATEPRIDQARLLRWLVMMQGSEIELGGFKGRTNKLVDGCYSWWCGGAFALLESLGVGAGADADAKRDAAKERRESADEEVEVEGEGEQWDDADDSLFNRRALQEYLLYAGQHPAGGLRDKPPKNADAYHTMYCLSGISSAQHRVSLSAERRAQISAAWDATKFYAPSGAGDVDTRMSTLPADIRQKVFEDALAWSEEEGGSIIVGGAENRVNATHPVFNLTITHVEGMMQYFYGQTVPPRPRPRARPGPAAKA
ncbi:hypothetical protein H0H92_009086 [Tricholoma furcatifolium]|nr:hypothetical protein H0H92_009086 [Tricholoma furcatifolium]